MDGYIRTITQIKQQNNADFPLADVNDLLGGYLQVSLLVEMNNIPSRRIHPGTLCYVKETSLIYQNTSGDKGDWNIWKSGNDGTTLIQVEHLLDLKVPLYEVRGNIAYVSETNDLRWYDGTIWRTFNRIYVQSTAPDDADGIWIDTSDDKVGISNQDIITNLTQALAVLQTKVNRMQYAFDNQMDFGDFTNSPYSIYNGQESIEPVVEDDTIVTQDVSSTGEPTEYKDEMPNCKSLSIKSGTYAQMIANQSNFVKAELLWCYDKKSLWIKDPSTLKLIQIGTTSSPIDDNTVDGIITSLINNKTRIVGIEFADMADSSQIYQISVKNGQLNIRNERLNTSELASNNQTLDTVTNNYSSLYQPIINTQPSPMIYINMFYCGGESDKYSYNAVSHNFIELSNLNTIPLNLKGMYLHYTQMGNQHWLTLPLDGIIPAGGTFLIKGAQSSVADVNTTTVKVGEPDMYWTSGNTTSASKTAFGVTLPFDDQGLIKLNPIGSLYLSGSDSQAYNYSTVTLSGSPYISGEVIKYYVHLVGCGTYTDSNNTTQNQPCELSPIINYGTDKLQVLYYTMDGVTQATKALSARNNVTDWTYLKLNNLNPEIDSTEYNPKNSEENKTVFFNKHLIVGNKPVVVNCNFGYNAHTTRCFTWISKGYYDEFIQFSNTSDFTVYEQYESFKAGSTVNRTINNRDNIIYDRIRAISTDGTAFTSHKFIKSWDEPTTTQTIYYRVGKDGAWSDVKQFTLRNRDNAISSGFSFVQVTDQQGFNQEEYKTWQLSAEYISSHETFDFCFNTGDYAQNGNRINEWLDYFNAGQSIISKMSHIGVVGNNDLSPIDNHVLGDGSDTSKNNPINMRYFFTFEHPYTIPTILIDGNAVYLDSVFSFIYGNTYFLGMNSEITSTAQTSLYGNNNVYETIKAWVTSDLTHIDNKVIWKIAACHEMPFTIITQSVILSTIYSGNTTRGGSHMNTLDSFWFSNFLQTNGFKLCIGGHKHTYAKSYPLIETQSQMIPRIQVTADMLKNMTTDTSLYIADGTTKYTYNSIEYTADLLFYKDENGNTVHCQYPLSWIQYRDTTSGDSYYKKLLCTFELVSSITAPTYVMCQATGYKLVSNKELPGQNIPWIEHYYPITGYTYNSTTKVESGDIKNAAQNFPHYIVWNIGTGVEVQNSNFTIPNSARNRILGQTKKLVVTSTPTKAWAYHYNLPITLDQLTTAAGNGGSTDNIIIE